MALPHDKYKGDIYLDAARGKSGYSYWHGFGCTLNATTTASLIWCEGGAYTYLSAADYLICASDDTNDDGASTGARTIQIYGMDSNYDLQNETITLDGFNAVTTTNQYLRIFRGIVRSAGSSGYNEGKICFLPDAAGNTFTAAGVPTTTATKLLCVKTTTSHTRMGLYTIPNSYTGYLVQAFGSSNNNQEATFSIWTRPTGEVWQSKGDYRNYRNVWSYNPVIPIPLAAKTDIEMRGLASASGADLSCGFTLLLINE